MKICCRPIILAALLLAPAAALAQQSADTVTLALGSPAIYETSLKALTILLVTAILIENALAVIFNWRVFLTYFSLRGVKTIVSFAVSYAVVLTFDIDVTGDLLGVYLAPDGVAAADIPDRSNGFSKILTALILSGGSSGVNNLMISLGYRERGRDQVAAAMAPPDKAWIAVWIERSENLLGPVQVQITEAASPTTDPGAIAGVVGARRPSLLGLLMRNPNRFPANGGYEVTPGKVYRIDIIGHDRDGKRIPDPVSGKEYRFAPRAIVDFEARL